MAEAAGLLRCLAPAAVIVTADTPPPDRREDSEPVL